MDAVDPTQVHGDNAMITKLNVTAIKVLDQDEALDFYVDKLGLEKAQDFQQGPVRWLTVRVPGDPNTEIYLEKPGAPVYDEATTEELRELITKDMGVRDPFGNHIRILQPANQNRGGNGSGASKAPQAATA
jgi:catechol 2,3-dioxygenase-like lactoylglutathione lyase family enzyme